MALDDKFESLALVMTMNVSNDWKPKEYFRDEDVPFAPDGSDTMIADRVERVRGIRGQFDGLKCVRKNIIQDAGDQKQDAAFKQRVTREARTLCSARHTHVVHVVHSYFHNWPRQLRFSIVMERADCNLEPFIRPPQTAELQIRPEWFGCLLSAIRHIHAMGIRHRDIKPTNILIKEGRVLLTDFGISKMGLGQTMPTTISARNASRSTNYCAPEVDQGRSRGRSADIFSLGAVFLEMDLAHFQPTAASALSQILLGHEMSFSKGLRHVQDWVANREVQLDEDTSERGMLSLSRSMMNGERALRPTANDCELDVYFHCTCRDTFQPTSDDRLVQACQENVLTTVQSLLAIGADVNTPGAIHQAAERGYIHIVEELLVNGASVDVINQSEQTALHCSSRSGRIDVVRILLRRHATADAQDENLQTALHGAAAHGYVDIVRMLLDAGADVSLEDIDGSTAQDFAKARHHDDVLDLLRSGSVRP